MIPQRSHRPAARIWWALLPYAGGYGYGRDAIPPENWRWWMRFDVVPYLLWRLVGKLPGSEPFSPMPPIACSCRFCRAVEAGAIGPDDWDRSGHVG